MAPSDVRALGRRAQSLGWSATFDAVWSAMMAERAGRIAFAEALLRKHAREPDYFEAALTRYLIAATNEAGKLALADAVLSMEDV